MALGVLWGTARTRRTFITGDRSVFIFVVVTVLFLRPYQNSLKFVEILARRFFTSRGFQLGRQKPLCREILLTCSRWADDVRM